MITMQTNTLLNKQTGELAFKMYRYDSMHQFDHVQRLNYFTLVWIQEGQGQATADYETHHFKADQIYAFAPYQPFMFEAGGPVKGVVLHFHTDFFCILKHNREVACNGVLFNNVYATPYVDIDGSTNDTLTMIIHEMEKDLARNELAMNESVIAYLKIVLIHCARLKNEQSDITIDGKSEDLFIVQKLKDLIDEQFREKHAPKDYAKALHISPNALAKISKSYFNKTLTALISERIIIEAKRELYLTNKTVKEIASELGYDDEFYFSRFFKKNTSITPSVFRKTVGFGKA